MWKNLVVNNIKCSTAIQKDKYCLMLKKKKKNPVLTLFYFCQHFHRLGWGQQQMDLSQCAKPKCTNVNFWAIWMHDVIRFPVVILSFTAMEPHTTACVCVCACAPQGINAWINVFASPPSLFTRISMWASPNSQAVCLTFDCKCLSLGRQPFLIIRITMLSNQ